MIEAQRVERFLGERLVLRRPLELHVASVARHHDIEVDLRRRVVRVVEVERRHAVADADGNGSDAVDDRVLGERSVGEQLRDGILQRDHSAGDRGATRSAVGLEDVAIDGDLPLAQLRHVDGGAEGAPD